MVRLGLLLLGSREAAEDVVHDAFLRLQPVLGTVSSPTAYLRAAVVNLVRDRHRRRQLEVRHLPAVSAGQLTLPEVDETWAALQALPQRYRSALVLRYYLDLPIAEGADALGVPPGTAKSWVHRGLQILKERVQP